MATSVSSAARRSAGPARAAAVRRRLLRAVLRHRRLLAVVLVAVAVVAAVAAARPPSSRTAAVAIAATDLAAGQPLAAADVATVLTEPELVPDGAYGPASVPVGRLLAGPVRRGEPLTDAALVGPDLVDQLAAGEVLTTVHVRDPSADLVGPGDVVRVVATDPRGTSTAAVIAEEALVVSVPTGTDDGGATGGVSPLVLAVSEPAALALSGAATTRVLDILVPAPGDR